MSAPQAVVHEGDKLQRSSGSTVRAKNELHWSRQHQEVARSGAVGGGLGHRNIVILNVPDDLGDNGSA